jgi:hypothetical protein
MVRSLAILAIALAASIVAAADTSRVSAHTSRIERHREMAQKRIREHQAMTQAHIEGRTPVCPAADVLGTNATFFSPAFGEIAQKQDANGQDSVSLNELRMYWHRIPDFGIKKFEIFPSETGWAQVLYWSGTTKEGKVLRAQEADIFRTDENFKIVRIENYHDWQQWKELAAFAAGKDPAKFDKADYVAELNAQAKSPTEVCRPKGAP